MMNGRMNGERMKEKNQKKEGGGGGGQGGGGGEGVEKQHPSDASNPNGRSRDSSRSRRMAPLMIHGPLEHP